VIVMNATAQAARLPGRVDERQDASARGSVIRNGDFRRLFLAAAVSQLGTQVSALAVPVVAVLALKASAGQVGFLAVLSKVAFLLIGLPAGVWIDRVRRRGVMIGADLVRASLLAVVPLLWWMDALTIDQLYAVVFFVGVATVFFDVAAQSFIPHVVGPDGLMQANSALVSLTAGGGIAGASIAGLLLQLLAAPVAIAVDAASYVWSAIFIGNIRRHEAVPVAKPGRSLLPEVADGIRHVLGHPILRAVGIAGATTNLAVQMIVTMMPVLLVSELDLSPGLLGVFFAIGGLGTLLGASTARPLADRIGYGRTLWLAGLTIAPAALLIPMIGRGLWLWPALLGWLVVTFKIGVDNVIQVSFRQTSTPERMLGRMNATMRVLMTGALAIGAANAALVGQYAGARSALWAGAVVLVLVWVPIFFSPIRRMRELPSPR
jgi:MFS family permease